MDFEADLHVPGDLTHWPAQDTSIPPLQDLSDFCSAPRWGPLSPSSMPQASTSEDPAVGGLHAEARALYEKANEAYKKEKDKKYAFIPLGNALRASTLQAEYYAAFYRYKYYDGEAAPAANKPGNSLHEYGFAIDAALGDDVALIRTCLIAAGWREMPGERWHFEARTGPIFARIEAYMKSAAVTTPRDNYVAALDATCKLEKRYRDGGDNYRIEREPLDRERRELELKRSSLEIRRRDLTSRLNDLRRERGEITTLRQRLLANEQRLRSMTFNRCPNGNRYEDCDHEDLKRAYQVERQRLQTTISNQRAELARRQEQYGRAEQAYNRDLEQFESDRAEQEQKTLDFNSRWSAFEKKYAEISKILEELAQWPVKQKALLEPIQAAVLAAPQEPASS